MFGNIFGWIRGLFPHTPRRQRRRQAAQTRRYVRLRLEGPEDLEARITPATFNPTDAVDLQSAIAYANSNPTEQVIVNLSAANTYNLNDIATQLTDQNTAGVLINGNGAILTAAANNRVFEVDSGDKLTLNNLTISGGDVNTTTAQGGGIADFGGQVTLSAVNVTNNTVQGSNSAQGGGIYVTGGSLTLESGCQISNNQAIGSNNAGGGGVFVMGAGNVNVTTTAFTSNTVQGGAGSSGVAVGGGLVCDNNAALNLVNSSFDGNTASGGGNGFGGGLYLLHTNASIINNTFGNNTVNGGFSAGGGVFASGSTSAPNLINDTIANNTAQTGGGFYYSGSPTLAPTLTNVILESNSASMMGPDYSGSIGAASSYDFISNTSGISGTIPSSGMILNNSTPQLDTLTFDPFTGLSYYPLLSNNVVSGAGTTSVVDTVAAAEAVPPANATDELGDPFVVNNLVGMGAVQPAGNAGGGGNTDTLIWNPQNGSDDATDKNNWYDQQQQKNGVVAPDAGNNLIFDGNTSQSQITWKAKVTVASITLQNSYTGQMYVNPGIRVTDAGQINNINAGNDASTLKLNFGAKVQGVPSAFVVSGGGTISNMILAGDPTGIFDLGGGSTEMAGDAADSYTLGAQFVIGPKATLETGGQSSLKFNNNGVSLTIYGELNVDAGTGNNIPLIDAKNGNSTFTNNVINVIVGQLNYYGEKGVTDTFTVPVWVQKGGTFNVSVFGGGLRANGGQLIVTDGSNVRFPGAQMYSVYMEDAASSVQLAYGETLECDNNYYQKDGTLETADDSICTLQAGNLSMGTVAIAGGGLKLNQPNPATYGTVKVNGDLNFAGTYYAYIAGAQGGAGNCDLVNVSGATDLTGSRLNVTVNGQLTQGKQWRIIDDTTAGKNIKGDFAAPITVNAPDNPNNLKLNNGLDPDDNTNYILSD